MHPVFAVRGKCIVHGCIEILKLSDILPSNWETSLIKTPQRPTGTRMRTAKTNKRIRSEISSRKSGPKYYLRFEYLVRS